MLSPIPIWRDEFETTDARILGNKRRYFGIPKTRDHSHPGKEVGEEIERLKARLMPWADDAAERRQKRILEDLQKAGY